MNQELKEIYVKIAQGITNEYDADIKYIAEQIEIYKTHEKSTDIIRKLALLFYDLLPEGRKEDLVKVIRYQRDYVHLLYYLCQYLMTNNEQEKALAILTILTKELETWMLPTEQAQYFSFDNLIEFFLYMQTSEQSKEIKRSNYPCHEMYRAISYLEFKKQNHKAAMAALKQARRWNPVDVALYLDQAEICLELRDFDQYAALSKEGVELAYDKLLLARCYRNLGKYYLEEKDYEAATANYYMSLVCDKNEIALKALYSMYEQTKEELPAPDMEAIQEVLEEKHISYGASTLVVDTLLQLAKEFDEASERPEAIQYLELAYDLTNDETLLPVIDEMKKTASPVSQEGLS